MKTKLTTIFKKSANTPPMWVCLLFALVISTNSWALTGVSSTPVVNNLSGTLVADRIDLSWDNSNKANLTPAEVENGNVKTGAVTTHASASFSVSAQGVLTINYEMTSGADWDFAEFEFVLPGENVPGVTSFMFDIDGTSAGVNDECIPYIMENSTGNAWYETSIKGSATNVLITPDKSLWTWKHGSPDHSYGQRDFHRIGFAATSPGVANGSFKISNVYYNTLTNQSALKIVRKVGSVPSSVSDGTVIDIAAGSSGFYSDNGISEGNTYYYAAFANINSTWTNIAQTSGIEVDATKLDADLTLDVTEVTIPVGGSFTLGVSPAVGYDGTISYSIAPSGKISREGDVFTGLEMGDAVITVSASATENYDSDTETCTVHVVKNFAGDLSAVENAGTVTLDWFYNLPISLATEGTPIYNNGSFTTTYDDGIRYFTYTLSNNTDNKYFGACDFKTPNVPNCKSFSFEYRGENNGTNPRVVPYAWLDGGAPNSGNIVANPVEIRSTWDEVTVIPSCNYYAGAANINNGAIDGLNFASYPVGCVAFFPMADGDVSAGTLQLRNAYFQIINSNSLTSSVALVRKDGSAPADASDGVVRYTGAPTTFADNSGLVAGHTYYYRLFVTYNDVEYASNAVSITMPGTAKEDPELSLPASSAVLKEGDTYTLEPTVAVGYNGTLAYEITAGSDKISLSGSTITAEAAGTATVRVTAPETTKYNQVTANFTVTVLAAPETNLAITNVDGDNVTLTWDVPGKIDLSTWSLSSDYLYSPQNPTSSDKVSYDPATEELTVSYVGSNGSQNGVAFPFELGNVETVSYDYIGYNVFPMVVKNGSRYFGGVPQGDYVEWHSESVSPNTKYWSQGDKTISDPSKAISICANPEAEPYSRTFRIRNVFYHCTGMTDIHHIVIMRTTGAAATDTVSGTKIYSGKMSHFVDTDSKAAGLYYYTLFAVYANGCIPVESVSAAYENPYKTYTRTGLTAGDYGTICLPYAVAAENIAGADIYEFNGWQTGSNVVELDLVDAMEAGHPYIYQATASEATWRYLEQNYTAAGSHKGLIGSYTKEEITPNDGNYIIYANLLYLVDCTQIYVGVNKAYINRPDAENAYEATSLAPGKKRVYMGVYGEQVITDIDQITNDQSPLNNKIIKDNQLFILRDGKIYNAQGQLVK